MRWVAPTEKDTANQTLEKRLWDAADQFRANSGLKAGQYSTPVLGLIFLRLAEARFAKRRAELEKAGASPRRGNSRIDDPKAYAAEGVLFLTPSARFDYLLQRPAGWCSAGGRRSKHAPGCASRSKTRSTACPAPTPKRSTKPSAPRSSSTSTRRIGATAAAFTRTRPPRTHFTNTGEARSWRKQDGQRRGSRATVAATYRIRYNGPDLPSPKKPLHWVGSGKKDLLGFPE